MFSCECSKDLRIAFFIEQLWWLLLNQVLVSEKNYNQEKRKKRKKGAEIAFALISLFYVSIQEPSASRSTTTAAFVFFP